MMENKLKYNCAQFRATYIGRTRQDKHLELLPLMYWVFMTTKHFLAWLGMTICVKKLEAGHNMSDDSCYLDLA